MLWNFIHSLYVHVGFVQIHADTWIGDLVRICVHNFTWFLPCNYCPRFTKALAKIKQFWKENEWLNSLFSFKGVYFVSLTFCMDTACGYPILSSFNAKHHYLVLNLQVKSHVSVHVPQKYSINSSKSGKNILKTTSMRLKGEMWLPGFTGLAQWETELKAVSCAEVTKMARDHIKCFLSDSLSINAAFIQRLCV